MPPIDLDKGKELLGKLKKSVIDFYSLSSLHFIHLGDEGLVHFICILNSIIENINNASVEELNSIYAIVLHKGAGKPIESHRAYRTISTCPVVAKALDYYMVDLYSQGWQDIQAETQFQGKDSSHELAALCITEAATHSITVNKQPMFALFLDAESTFDKVAVEQAVRCAYAAGTQDQGLLYLQKRLSSRLTYIEWQHELLGPIMDTVGLEQGGCASDKVYRLVNNEQLKVAQNSQLGVQLGLIEKGPVHEDEVLSSVGLADDVALLANSMVNLKALLYLTDKYCQKYNVKLVSSKTKLLVFHSTKMIHEVMIDLLANPIEINGQRVEPSSSALYVGVVRSNEGNGPHISSRISAHRRSVFGLLNIGLGRKHYSNPAVSVKIDQIFSSQILLSGLSCLSLTCMEEKMLDQYFKVYLERLFRLHQSSPSSFVFLLAGRLPCQHNST